MIVAIIIAALGYLASVNNLGSETLRFIDNHDDPPKCEEQKAQ